MCHLSSDIVVIIIATIWKRKLTYIYLSKTVHAPFLAESEFMQRAITLIEVGQPSKDLSKILHEKYF